MSLKSFKYDKVFSDSKNYCYDKVLDFKKYLKDYYFDSVFEVGCGNGRNLSYLKYLYEDLCVSGIDFSSIGVQVCRNNGLDVILGSADKIPVYNKKWDVVLTVHSLEQMKYIIDDVIKEIYRICNKYVVCFEPLFELQNFFGKYHNFMYDYVKGLPFLLEKHGFNIVMMKNLGIGSFINRTCLIVGVK